MTPRIIAGLGGRNKSDIKVKRPSLHVRSVRHIGDHHQELKDKEETKGTNLMDHQR